MSFWDTQYSQEELLNKLYPHIFDDEKLQRKNEYKKKQKRKHI